MPAADLSELAFAAAVFVLAGAVKGILGMGMPTVAIGLLGLAMPVAAAAALLTAPSLVTNLWQAAVGPGLAAAVRRLWTLQVGILAGATAMPLLFTAPPDAVVRRVLGICLLAYGALGLLGRPPRQLPARHEASVGLLAGIATGIVTGFTGVFVLPLVPYLQALGLRKDAMAQALGLSFTTSTVALAASLALQGHLDLRSSTGSLAMVLPAVAGMWLGQRVRGSMSEALFRRAFFAGLLLLGAWLALR